jgi:hypothetical protein
MKPNQEHPGITPRTDRDGRTRYQVRVRRTAARKSPRSARSKTRSHGEQPPSPPPRAVEKPHKPRVRPCPPPSPTDGP